MGRITFVALATQPVASYRTQSMSNEEVTP